MELKLVQSQTQKLILSPQIRQYLRLLQLPLAQLSNLIEQELAENPALEEISRETSEEVQPPQASEGAQDDRTQTEELHFDNTIHTMDRLDENLRDSLYGQEDLAFPEPEVAASRKNYQESLITRKESLFDYLIWQLGFLDLSDEERKIADEIIGNLTDDGYLNSPLEEIAQACNSTPAVVEVILTKIQSLDPPGIAARNLQECLSLQLQNKEEPSAELARRTVRDCLPFLERRQWEDIARQLQVNVDEIHKAARLIARLDPKPGRTFYTEDPIAVTPDASIQLDDSQPGKLRIEICDDDLPELRVNPYYRRLLKSGKLDAKAKRFLREKIQAAIDFVKALAQRGSTLRRITEEIVAVQTPFFEKGFSHLKPLRLKDISSRLGIHESTISRAIQGKYISTPQGTIPYKSFFSSKLERTEGEAESQKSMMEKIRELIKSEDPAHPLSDQAICDTLQKQGIRIARRTVAKYRDLLKILPSHLRQKR